ncbi:MAG TPA: DUF3857 domain-containing transglutaminase family protein, partial [Daejeonella sp.]|nr:DUF3857 domain-containing transglutaminase family protein [Daejeonella sp.]
MRFPVVFSMLMLTVGNLIAQPAYQVSTINKELLPRASAVIRNFDLRIVVKDADQVSYHYKIATTVLNKNGDEAAALYLPYNKSMQIRSVKGAIYNEFSILVSKLSEKSFKDVSAISDFSLFEDSRVKLFRPAVTTYPYTVEYEYEIQAKHTMYFPNWFPKSSADISVEKSAFHFSSSPEFTIRYRERNYNGEPVKIHETEKVRSYNWEIKNLKASRFEPYSLEPEDLFASVQIAPNAFKYLGVQGAFTNWNEMGTWMDEKLLKGRNEIPAQTAAYIKSLTKDISDPKLKARKIYEFVQAKTRYVSVQIGIGGFQPITAAEVDKMGYGDCKGLANYTQGLLKIAGIDSYYAVIYAGDKKRDAIPDFASMDQFNHVILAIPFANETIWIDCTSKVNPFGYLGNFTDDRLALICTEQGGKLIRTPKFTEDRSLQHRKASFIVDAPGNLTGNMTTTFEGSQYDNREMLMNEPITEQIKRIPEFYNIGAAQIVSFKLSQNKSINPITTENIDLKVSNYATRNGQEIHIPLNQLNRQSPAREISNRENMVYVNRGYLDM